jgi:hypothetical protein
LSQIAAFSGSSEFISAARGKNGAGKWIETEKLKGVPIFH